MGYSGNRYLVWTGSFFLLLAILMKPDDAVAGTLNLDAGYTSGTVVLNGTLLSYSNDPSFSGALSVVVGNNATLGFIYGSVTATSTQPLILGSGDSFYEAAGNSHIVNSFTIQSGGTLRLTLQSDGTTSIIGASPFYTAYLDGDSVFQSGSTLSSDISISALGVGGGTPSYIFSYPTLQINGNLDLGVNTLLNLNVATNGATSTNGSFLPLIAYTGTLSGKFVVNGIAVENDTPFLLNGNTVELDYGTGSNSIIGVEILSVPEPSLITLLAVSLLFLSAFAFRERRSIGMRGGGRGQKFPL